MLIVMSIAYQRHVATKRRLKVDLNEKASQRILESIGGYRPISQEPFFCPAIEQTIKESSVILIGRLMIDGEEPDGENRTIVHARIVPMTIVKGEQVQPIRFTTWSRYIGVGGQERGWDLLLNHVPASGTVVFLCLKQEFDRLVPFRIGDGDASVIPIQTGEIKGVTSALMSYIREPAIPVSELTKELAATTDQSGKRFLASVILGRPIDGTTDLTRVILDNLSDEQPVELRFMALEGSANVRCETESVARKLLEIYADVYDDPELRLDAIHWIHDHLNTLKKTPDFSAQILALAENSKLLQAHDFHVKYRYLYNGDFYLVAIYGNTVLNMQSVCAAIVAELSAAGKP